MQEWVRANKQHFVVCCSTCFSFHQLKQEMQQNNNFNNGERVAGGGSTGSSNAHLDQADRARAGKESRNRIWHSKGKGNKPKNKSQKQKRDENKNYEILSETEGSVSSSHADQLSVVSSKWDTVSDAPLLFRDNLSQVKSYIWQLIDGPHTIERLRPYIGGVINIDNDFLSYSTDHPVSLGNSVGFNHPLLPSWLDKVFHDQTYIRQAGYNRVTYVKIYPTLLRIILTEKSGMNVTKDSVRYLNDAYLRENNGRLEIGWDTVRVAVQILAYNQWLSKHTIPGNLDFSLPEVCSKQL